MPRLNLKTITSFQTPLVLLLVAGAIAGWGGACGPGQSSKKGKVVINEVGCHGVDFVEIVNVSDTEQDISGWFVADNLYKEGHQYEIPEDNILEAANELNAGADEYFFVSKREEGAEEGFSFGIGCGKDTIYLLDGEQNIVDQVDVGAIDVYEDTWGRMPNITGSWCETTASPGKENDASALCFR